MTTSVYRGVSGASSHAAPEKGSAAHAGFKAGRDIRTPDLCVIGAGAGGLTVTAAAAALGVSVVLIEKHRMGGDCLNAGCVPSKALIVAARRAHSMRTAGRVGLRDVEPKIEMRRVSSHIRGVISGLAPNDASERFEALGADVIRAAGRFIDHKTVEAGDVLVRARRFIVATGSSPAVPAIPGLETVPYLTNESIFGVDQGVSHLIVVGAGPVGLELALAYRRLGAKVTVVDQAVALSHEDPELAAIALRMIRREGVSIEEGAAIEHVRGGGGAIDVHLSRAGAASVVSGSHLLIAAGRRANTEKLGLEAAGVRISKGRIDVDAGMRTSNRRVFAIGAVAGGEHTHAANAQAEIVIRRALFRQPARFNSTRLPRVVFTDPEIAQVGLTESEARAVHRQLAVYRSPFSDNDRAVIEASDSGMIKVVCDRKGAILGAGIVGSNAGELIQVWSLAISQGLRIDAMTQWVSPYPTLGEISKRVAVAARAEQARRPIVRKILTFLRNFG